MPRAPLRGSVAAVLVVLVATGLKLLVLLAARPDLYFLWDNPEPVVTFIGEELHRGTVAVDLIDGTVAPLLDYQYAPFFGGGLVVGVLAVPFFLVFGPSVVSLKLVGLAFNALAVLCLFKTLDRYVSRRAAWIGGLLFGLASPGYTALVLTAYGSHVESNAFGMLCVYLALRAYEGGRVHTGYVLALGLVAGFATYFSYIVVLLLGALFLARLAVDRRLFLRRDFAALAASFIVGFSPWIAYNIVHDLRGLQIYGASIGGHLSFAETLAHAAERIADAFTHGIPGGFFFRDVGPIPRSVPNAILALAFGFGIAGCAVSRIVRREPGAEEPVAWVHPGTLALVHPLLFFLAFGTSDFVAGNKEEFVVTFRYLYVLHPLSYAALAITLDRLANRGPAARLAAWASAASVGLVATVGVLQLFAPSRWGDDLETPGYERGAFGRFYVMMHAETPERIVATVDRIMALDQPQRADELLFGMGMTFRQAQRPMKNLQPEVARQLVLYEGLRERLHERVDERYKPYFAPLEPGGRQFDVGEREAFWRYYKRRQARERREGR